MERNLKQRESKNKNVGSWLLKLLLSDLKTTKRETKIN